jgi:adenylate cyclase
MGGISLFVLQGLMRSWLGSLSFTTNLTVRTAIYAAIIVPVLYFQLGNIITRVPLDPLHKTFWISIIYSIVYLWFWLTSFSGSLTSSGPAHS